MADCVCAVVTNGDLLFLVLFLLGHLGGGPVGTTKPV